MNIIEQLNWRYATKDFDPNKQINEEKLDRILEATNLTATSLGLQQFRLIVVKSQELKDKLYPASFNQVQIKNAPYVLVFACKNNIDDNYVNSYVRRMEKARSLPENALDSFVDLINGFRSAKNPEQTREWEDKQAYIGLGNLLTVAALEEVDACPIEGFNPKEYDEILGLEELDLRSVLVCPIGYRAEEDKYQHLAKVRLELDKFVINK